MKTVLITGCSSGIGRATAKAFADSDWTTYATSRDESDIADLDCRTDSLDVTDEAEIERVVDRIAEETGRIHCLVNNAGYGQYGPIEDIPTDRLHKQFDVNVYGPHRLARAVLPLMRAQEDGTIINVSSIYGQLSTPGGGVYAGSKFALEAMSDALRAEVEGLGIDVSLMILGPVDTGFRDRANDEVEGLDRHRDYEWVYDAYEDANLTSGVFATEPETVATTIHDVACLSDPEARYPVGTLTKYALYTRFLPDRLYDLGFRFIRKLF